MATTGRRGSGALAAILAASLLAASLLAAGCAGGAATSGSAATSSGTASSGGTAKSGAQSTPASAGASGPLAWQRFCSVPQTASLRTALRRPVPASLRGEVIPLGLSTSGQVAYVSAWMPGFAGVGALNLATGQLRQVHRYPNPATDQADGSSGGRWLVWEQTHSLQSLDAFTVYAWDSVSGRLRQIGHSLPGPGGTPWPSPWHAPAVSGHYAAWAQGYGPGGQVEVRLADLATGRVRVLRTGHTQAPFFDEQLVVWPESDQPGTQTTLHAYNPSTGQPAVLPTVLRAVHGTDFVATDGTRTAYLSPDLATLYYSPAPTQQARIVLRLPQGATFSALTMTPGSLAWSTTTATYLASTRTGAYTQVTERYGMAAGSGHALMLSDAPISKAAHPVLPLRLLGQADLNRQSCR
ncbi:MAG: hypothetical protein ABJB47_01855 [Actinomycetota bacterium]